MHVSVCVYVCVRVCVYIMCACVVGGGMGTCALVCTRVVDGCAHVFIVQGVFVDVLSNNVYVRGAHAENVNMEE